MQRERWLLVKEIASDMESLPKAQRDAWLRERCAGEAGLFEDVLGMVRENAEETQGHTEETYAVLPPMAGDLAGIKLGSWRLLRELGSGGMGAVWLAERADAEFHMLAAVKLIKNEQASNDLVARFKRERQILADLKHPNISILHDGGTTTAGMPYLVMEYVDGELIDSWVEARRLSPEEILMLFRQVCIAVSYAHHKGVVHRDIKPHNIMVTSEGVPKLMDFGIAGKKSEPTNLPNRGNLLTPEYAPPESLLGGGKTKAADIYSLGLVLFRLLSGIRPRQAFGKWAERLCEIGKETGSDLHMRVGVLLGRVLTQDPSSRLPSVDMLIAEIDQILSSGRRAHEITEVDQALYDAVLWYHPDARPAVENMARRLEDETGLRVWLNVWHLVPGEDEVAALEAAYLQSPCLVVVRDERGCGPWEILDQRGALTRLWQRHKRRVVPVLLAGAQRPERESGLPAFMRRRTWAGLTSDLGHDHLEVLARAIRGLPPGRRETPLHDVCPFRGLEVFREEDRRFYFGREALTQRLYERMARRRFLAVLGPSGSGKSSLVQAGLLPMLREQQKRLALFTPSHHPLEELAFSLKCHAGFSTESDLLQRLCATDEGLADVIEGEPEGESLCLVIDQFEEVFTLAEDQAEVRRFLNGLLYALEHLELSIVLTMRSDFLGKCAAWPDLNNFVIDNMVQTEPMSDEELARAISEPARLAGLAFEKGLAERILEEVKGASGELPLMEHALLELYERRNGNTLTSMAFREIGGVEGALATRAESEYMRLDESGKGLLRNMFIHCLVQPGEGSEDTRRRATREELLAEGTDKSRNEELLNQWVNAHLLTSHYDERRGEDMVDVAHEALIRKWERIHVWMEEDRDTARLLARLRRQAKTWAEAERDPDLLLRGAPLLQMVDLLEHKTLHLSQLAREFVAAGKALREEEQQRLEARQRRELEAARGLAMRARLIAGLTLAGLITVGVLAFYLYQSQQDTRRKASALAEVSDFMINLFKVSEEERRQGWELTARELVDRGAKDLQTRLHEQQDTRKRILEVVGRIYFNMGHYDQAATLQQEHLDLARSSGDMTSLVNSLSGLVGTELSRGNYLEARTLAEEAVSLGREHLGKSAALAGALHLLGRTFNDLGDFKNARTYVEEGLKMKRAIYGETHLGIAESLAELAQINNLTGDYESAETLFFQSLEMRRRLLGDKHQLVAESYKDLAFNYFFKEDLTQAERYIRMGLKMLEELRGDNHPEVMEMKNGLATINYWQGDYDAAEPLYREVYDFYVANERGMQPDALLCLFNLATVLRGQRDYKQADELLTLALERNRAVYGPNHENVGRVLFELGIVRERLGFLKDAEKFYKEAYQVRRQHLGIDHINVAHTLYQLADLMTFYGKRFAESRPYAEETLQIYAKHLDENSRFVLVGRSLLVFCEQDEVSVEQTEKGLSQAWLELLALVGPEDFQTKRAFARLLIFCQLKQPEREVFWIEEGQRQKMVVPNEKDP